MKLEKRPQEIRLNDQPANGLEFRHFTVHHNERTKSETITTKLILFDQSADKPRSRLNAKKKLRARTKNRGENMSS